MANKITGDLKVTGSLDASSGLTLPNSAVKNVHCGADMALARSKLGQDTLQTYPINLMDFRVWNAIATNLPGTSAADDLSLNSSAFGIEPPMLLSSDLKAAGDTTLYARAIFTMPPEYDTGETVQIRIRSAMVTTVADTTAGVDVVAYINDGDGGISADMIATGEIDSNSLTHADHDFTFSSSTVVPGDQIDFRVSFGINDAAAVTTVVGAITEVAFLLDIRG